MTIDFPVTVNLFGHSVLIHPILEWIGIFVGMRLYGFLKRNHKTTLSKIQGLSVILGALLGALIGSKLIGTLEVPIAFLKSENPLLYFWTSNTIVGGLAFGLIGVEISKKIIGYKESTGDLMVYPLIVAMCIGRVGCFLTGIAEQTYGVPTTSIFGMHLGDDYLRHPVALYEIVFLIILGLSIYGFRKKYTFPSGVLFQLFMLSYFSFRFVLDFIKPKINVLLELSTIQITCLVVVIYYIFKINNHRQFIHLKH
ncbi:prolipoprotein diacylglyceryl transferase [Faecalibacter sp. LW9]|uniref:prolipoprotein diacylglyceryl transferase n=1 Tax=Faecalibacter sp. LW9 TaxID=3103144 RepID=UPI002AFF0EFD|nr:prolipoprotein diacylglyceryl transferase family protein [Faecalibacter sp. LW9]